MKNYEKLTENFNKLRMEVCNKSYTSSELYNLLNEIGINKNIVGSMVSKGIIQFEEIGSGKKGTRTRLYSFQRNVPLHINQLKSLYKAFNEKMKAKKRETSSSVTPIKIGDFSDDILVKELKNRGYIIQKVIGFDTERFKREHSVMFKDYQITETL